MLVSQVMNIAAAAFLLITTPASAADSVTSDNPPSEHAAKDDQPSSAPITSAAPSPSKCPDKPSGDWTDQESWAWERLCEHESIDFDLYQANQKSIDEISKDPRRY